LKIPQLLALAFAAAPAAGAQTVSATLISNGLQRPSCIVADPTDANRLFVVERTNGVAVLNGGVEEPVLFLDLSAEVGSSTQGIMGMALHPDYANNGRFYLVYTDSAQLSHVAEYTATANPNIADPLSRVQILGPEPQPAVVHNWNLPHFGPDGMLYVSTGDGVLSSDNVFNNAQDLDSLFGKILRLDVDLPPPYIPADNPFVGQGGREEVFLFGVRQPWRFEFDAATGDLWIGDVGPARHEEVNVLPAGTAAGANLGWECAEGMHECNNLPGCISCTDGSLIQPIFEYPHSAGRCAIIGGGVYRGSAMPWLVGKYLYADYCTGRLFSLRFDGTRAYDWVEHTVELGGAPIQTPTTFGRTLSGEVLIADQVGQELWLLGPGESCGTTGGQLTCDAQPNSTGLPAILGAGGSLTIGDNDLRFYVANLPINHFGYMLMSQSAGNVPAFGGSQGTLCLGAPIVRFVQDVLLADPEDGTLTFAPNLASLPSFTVFQPGDSWIFQFWFRDDNPGSTSNTSDAVSVTFCN
jgi:glucose/arabinose dehydrogenase